MKKNQSYSSAETTPANQMKKNILILTAVIFLLSLIPMYAIGRYAHPSVDDYYYGDVTSVVWDETHSLPAVLGASFDEMITTYYEWQGNFSAIFLMRLQPGIFGEQYYRIVPFILITTYLIGTILFIYTVLSDVLKASKTKSFLLAIGTAFVSIQLVPTPSDSFYWFNGSIYYTFFYSLMLIMFTIMLSCRRIKSIRLVISGLITMLLAFLIGGSNFATALFTTIILTLLVGYMVYALKMKKNSLSSLHFIMYLLTYICLLAGLMISIKAPGNAIRQASVGGSTGLVKTFIYTFAYGGYSLASLFETPCLIFFIAIVPLLYGIAKNSEFAFKYPLLVLVFTFGLYCSAGTPVFYAQGLRIPYRMMNIIYFSAYIFAGFNLMYFLGWLSRKYGDTALLSLITDSLEKLKNNPRTLLCSYLICILVFFAACIGRIEVGETENKSGKAVFSNLTTSMAATYSLVNGDASAYDAQMTARDAYLRASVKRDEVVPALTAYPELIFRVDISDDVSDWHNAHVAKFYHLETIKAE